MICRVVEAEVRCLSLSGTVVTDHISALTTETLSSHFPTI